MAQPEAAAGGDDFIVPAEPTLEDRLSAALTAEPDEEPQAEPEAPAAEEPESPEAEADEPTEDDIEEDEPEQPAIAPPISWTAEEKAKFAELPRELQETVTRREADREKFVQTKAQEAAQAREAARTEAMQFAAQLKDEAVQHLTQYAKQFEIAPPDPSLIATDPQAYAQQLSTYQYAQAQREQAQRDADKAAAERDQYQAALQQHEAQQFHQRLQAELPEAFESSGQTNRGFIDTLAATAEVLGYDAHSIANATVEELKALKAVSEIKAKADKYDKLMVKKMERVRAGKDKLPPIAKPGAAREAGAAKASQYAADRQAMRSGDDEATLRVLRAHINS
jgi:hypothetical protein